MAKNTAALVTALVAVALYWLLNVLGLGRVATGTVLAAALGSELWVVASQSMWQHGPAALALVLTMLLLAPAQPSRGRLLWAGLMTALLVCFRPTNLVFALVIALWVMRYSPRRVLWFGVFPAILGALLLGYNYWFFGSAAGGAVLLESSATHHAMHGVRSAWSGNLLEGLAGTLISPNRGLFIFTPWIPVALAILPWSGARIPAGHLVRWLFWSLLPFLFILSKYSVWWGGYSFGPRYWTDAIPLFAVMLALGLAWAFDHSRILSALLFTGVLLAIVAQVIGAACFPSSWNARPKSVDLHHERLWDWSDTELRRCIHDGVQRPRPAGLSLAAPSRVPPVRQSLVSPAPAKCPVASCSIPMCLCLPAAG